MRLVIRLHGDWLTTWKQFWCAYRGPHGHLVVERNHLSVCCNACGYESDGLDLETRRIRILWMHDRHRQLWQSLRHQRRA